MKKQISVALMAAGVGFGVVAHDAQAIGIARVTGAENSGRLAGLGAGILAGTPIGAIAGGLGGGLLLAPLSLSLPEALLAPALVVLLVGLAAS